VDEVFSRTDSTGIYAPLTDALGSTLLLADWGRNIQTEYVYDSWGGTTTTGGSNTNSFQYTGRENDANELYYFRARYYNPRLGRFISQDPIGFNGGIDVYAYVGNNPINYTDLFGLCGGDGPSLVNNCGDEPPRPPDNQTPYPDNYYYRDVNANYMYQFGGNNPWGNRVRSCLLCMYNRGVPAADAHKFCYESASSHVGLLREAQGYGEAYSAAGRYYVIVGYLTSTPWPSSPF
jgi:RHS repeat-associated protein